MTKFREDRTKIVDFSLIVTFLASPENTYSPSTISEALVESLNFSFISGINDFILDHCVYLPPRRVASVLLNVVAIHQHQLARQQLGARTTLFTQIWSRNSWQLKQSASLHTYRRYLLASRQEMATYRTYT